MPKRTNRERDLQSDAFFKQMTKGTPFVEDLPNKYVFYGWCGTFIAFSKEKDSKKLLCSCSRQAVENYLELRKLAPAPRNSDPLNEAPLHQYLFGQELAKQSLGRPDEPMSVIGWGDKLCHRCNMATPTPLYCHEMYGGKFVQKFGWYVNQNYLRLGIGFGMGGEMPFLYLPKWCPDELSEEIKAHRILHAQRWRITEHIQETGAKFGWSNPDWVKTNDLDKELGKSERRIGKYVENLTRKDFGFKKVGDRFVGETTLYRIVKRLYPDVEIQRHIRPEWLSGLELDIFIPEFSLGIEYQGQQHFHSIKAWGGEKAFNALKERDKLKKEICAEEGVALLEVDYTEPLTEAHIKAKLEQRLLT